MNIEITYPETNHVTIRHSKCQRLLRNFALFAVIIAILLSSILEIAGIALVTILTLWAIWPFFSENEMFDTNKIYTVSRFICRFCVLLIAADVTLLSGVMQYIVPYICTVGISTTMGLFLWDYPNQKHNAMPMVTLMVMAVLNSGASLFLIRRSSQISSAVMGLASMLLLVLCILILRRDLARDTKWYFSLQ